LSNGYDIRLSRERPGFDSRLGIAFARRHQTPLFSGSPRPGLIACSSVVVARHEGTVGHATRAAQGADEAAAAGPGPTCTLTYHRALCEEKRTASHFIPPAGAQFSSTRVKLSSGLHRRTNCSVPGSFTVEDLLHCGTVSVEEGVSCGQAGGRSAPARCSGHPPASCRPPGPCFTLRINQM
jgi:hypothetical protein